MRVGGKTTARCYSLLFDTYIFPSKVLTLLITGYRGFQTLYFSKVLQLLELVFNVYKHISHSV